MSDAGKEHRSKRYWNKEDLSTEPNIILLDVETSPQLGYTWGSYEQNVLAVLEPVKIICAAWKQLSEKKVSCKSLPDYDGYKGGVVDDTKLVLELWDVLDRADIILGHNLDSFDIKVINARFIAHGLNAPSDYKSVDTLKAAKKYFKFNNNTLNELGKYLKEGQKAPTGGFDTWLKCMAGEKVSWDRMVKYNIQDVLLLERVYLRLRPFMANHPNLNLITPDKAKKTGEHLCGSCQSSDTVKRGFAITKAGRYQRWQCNNCGSWSSGLYERVQRAETEGREKVKAL